MEKKTLLLVDDEKEIFEVISHEIGALDFNILTASTGSEALEKITNSKIDVILSDINMPSMNGLELLTILKEKQIKIPVILMTGQTDNERNLKAWILGAFDFLSKPLDYEKLKIVLSTAIEIGESGISPRNMNTKRKSYSPFTLFWEKDFIDKLQSYCYKKNTSVSTFIYNQLKEKIDQ